MRRPDVALGLCAVALAAGLVGWLLLTSEEHAEVGSAAVLRRPTAPAADAPRVAPRGDASPANSTLPVVPLQPAVPATGAPANTAPTPSPPAGDDARFRGRLVTDSGEPIAGATVVFYPDEKSWPLYDIKPDSRGAIFNGLPRTLTDATGSFELQARWRGGPASDNPASVPWLIPLTGDHAMRPIRCAGYAGGTFDAGDIALEAGARLAGRIVDLSGRPIEGAVVRPHSSEGFSMRDLGEQSSAQCQLAEFFAETRSGPDGRFLTVAVWKGRTDLQIVAPGFLTLDRQHLPLHAGKTTDAGDLVLDPGLGLTGTVRDADGAPVAGARVIFWVPFDDEERSRDADGLPYDWLLKELELVSDRGSVLTDAAGRFEIAPLTPEPHALFIDAAGFEPLCLLEVQPGGLPLAVPLVRAATLELALVDASTQQPVPGARVHARRLSGREGSSADDIPVIAGGQVGTFRVERVGLRLTELAIVAPGFATTGIALEGMTPPARIQLTVPLARELRVAGRVTGADGAPIPQATVRAIRMPLPTPTSPSTAAQQRADAVWRPDPEVRSDAAGGYSLGGLAAGRWWVRAKAPGFTFVDRALTLDTAQLQTALDITLPAVASISGVHYRADGSPNGQGEQRFEWVPRGDGYSPMPARTSMANAQGRYELADMRPGTWRLTGNPRLEITLAPGERRELDLHEVPDLKLTGRVLTARGAPAAGAGVFIHVTPTGQSKRYLGFERADPEGRWSSRANTPGTFEVVASMPAGGGMSAPLVFEMQASEQRDVVLSLGALSVRGRVLRAEDDVPLSGACVHIVPLLEDGERGAQPGMFWGTQKDEFTCVTGADGRFESTGLPPGRLAVGVTADGARCHDQPVLVLTPDSVPELTIRLVRTGSLSVVARHRTNLPVEDTTRIHARGPGQQATGATRHGRFHMEDLMPGTWHLTLGDVGQVLAEATVTVVSGQQAEVELIVP